jgi:hypothetical protein
VANHYVFCIVEKGGGDPEVLNEKGSTPLERTQERGYVDVMMFLKRQILNSNSKLMLAKSYLTFVNISQPITALDL